jgi:MFS transporter, Spinster family, sphingosine-1-phosphate transporter
MAREVSAAGSTAQAPTAGRPGRYASYIFWLMFFINMLNYLDRWVFTGLSSVIQQELRLNDFQIGLLTSGFLLVYTIVAMPLGFYADRIARKTVVAIGVAIWSLATALTGLAGNFASLLGVRTLLGIGEGSYYPAGTPMLAAYFPPSRRAQVLARWSTGALIGAAVGFLLAQPFSQHPGEWRYAFYFTGIPGLLFAFLMWGTREKKRHEEDPPVEAVDAGSRSAWQRIRSYLRIPTVRVIIAMHALGFFGLTGVTTFLVIYLTDTYGQVAARLDNFGNVVGKVPGAFPQYGLTYGQTSILAGVLIIVGGIAGNLLGGMWADRMSRRRSGARVLTGGLGFLLAAPCVLGALGSPYVLRIIPAYYSAGQGTQVAIGVGVFAVFALLAAVFLNIYNGPTSAALLDVVPAGERGAVGGTELSLAHLLGDVYAAVAIGALADKVLTPSLGGDQIGLALLLTVPAALVLSGIVGIWGSRFYHRDVEALGATAASVLGTVPVAD